MRTHNTTPGKSLQSELDKDKTHYNQLQTIFLYLKDHVATASMVTEATGVPQKCITRYKRDLEKAGLLFEVEKKDCLKTGFKAWYLTTNPALAPKAPEQLNLFDNPIPTIQSVKVIDRQVDLKANEYEVQQCSANDSLFIIIPFNANACRSIAWPIIFKGSLDSCDAFIEKLKNTGSHE